MSNRNIFWAKTFVDELARCGLDSVVIAPGSRSTPLVIAFAENPEIKVYSVIDERSAAFFALGLALATDKPSAVVCSSGTATANFYPAIIEARYSHVPLLVLTADRQHELRSSGANQTIDQIKMFGDHVLWFYDVALPEAEPPAVAVRNLRTLADRAYATANGIVKGAVHLNFPFRKPLEPIPVETDKITVEPYDSDRPYTVISQYLNEPSTVVFELTEMVKKARRGLIIVGSRAGSADLCSAVAVFARRTGFPVWADPLSNMRFHQSTIYGAYDTFLLTEPPFEPPDLIIHLGGMPASAALENYLNSIPTQQRVLLTKTGQWTDPYHRLSHVFQIDAYHALPRIGRQLKERLVDMAWVETMRSVEETTWKVLKQALNAELFDGSAISAVVESLPQGTELFIANSLPIRHVEQYAHPNDQGISVYCNRGASGIDGTISTAFGVAAAHPDKAVVLIIGDLAFYHDMNGLLAYKRGDIKNLTIVLINNDGGGIFNRLPIAKFDPPFTDLFLTPHGLDFKPAIQMYGFKYVRAERLTSLRDAVKKAIKSKKQPTIIEVRTDAHRDHERRHEINQRVTSMLKEKFLTT